MHYFSAKFLQLVGESQARDMLMLQYENLSGLSDMMAEEAFIKVCWPWTFLIFQQLECFHLKFCLILDNYLVIVLCRADKNHINSLRFVIFHNSLKQSLC